MSNIMNNNSYCEDCRRYHSHCICNKQIFIPFNAWSKERIAQGRKFCTSRHKKYLKDPRVIGISDRIKWGIIKKHFWKLEGANSPDELQRVIEDIYKRPVEDDEEFFLHFGDFR